MRNKQNIYHPLKPYLKVIMYLILLNNSAKERQIEKKRGHFGWVKIGWVSHLCHLAVPESVIDEAN